VEHLRPTCIDSRPSSSAGSSASHPRSTILTDPTVVLRPSITTAEATTESVLSDFRPDITKAGPSNQDPAIPNISPKEQPSGEANVDEDKRKMFKLLKPHNEKGDPRITPNHLKQMSEDPPEAHGEAHVEHGGQRRKRVNKEARRGRPQQAQLSSGRGPISQISSDESVHAHNSGTPPGPGSTASYPFSRPSRSPVVSVIPDVLINPVDVLLELGTGTTTSSASHADLTYDHAQERQQISEFYETHGYMPAPRQTPVAMRRRLRVIRQLGLEKPDEYLKRALNRFTRLAVSIFKTKVALVSVMGKDRQIFLSEIGFGRDSTESEVAFCSHTIAGTGEHCLVVPNAAED
jgi:hypothetical protein